MMLTDAPHARRTHEARHRAGLERMRMSGPERHEARAAMRRWRDTLDREDLEGDPRDLVWSAYAHAWTAGQEYAENARIVRAVAALEAAERLVESGRLISGEALLSCLGCGAFNIRAGEPVEHAPGCLYTILAGGDERSVRAVAAEGEAERLREIAARMNLVIEVLVALVRDEWPSALSLEEIALRGRCSDEQVEALRQLEAGELSFLGHSAEMAALAGDPAGGEAGA